MARQDISSFRGEQFTLAGTVTKGGQGYPTGSVTGFNLLFTAKRRKSDALAAAVVAKALLARVGYEAESDDITLAIGGAYTVAIESDDTSSLTSAELLSYDIVLVEPDGTLTVVDYGTWKIGRGAGA